MVVVALRVVFVKVMLILARIPLEERVALTEWSRHCAVFLGEKKRNNIFLTS